MDQPLHLYSSSTSSKETVFKSLGVLDSRDGICLRARTGRGRAVNSRGGSARPRSPLPRDAPRRACAAPAFDSAPIGSSPASESDPLLRLAGSATGRGFVYVRAPP